MQEKRERNAPFLVVIIEDYEEEKLPPGGHAEDSRKLRIDDVFQYGNLPSRPSGLG